MPKHDGESLERVALKVGSKVVPEELVTEATLGQFIAQFATRTNPFKVSRGDRRVPLEEFYDQLLKFEGITKVTLTREERATEGGRGRLVVDLFSTLNPLPGLAHRSRQRQRSKNRGHTRKTVDYEFMDEVSPAVMKSNIEKYYQAMAKPGEIERVLARLARSERRIAKRGKEPVFVPLIDIESGVRTDFDEVLVVTVPFPEAEWEEARRRAHWESEFRRVQAAYGFTDEDIQRAKACGFAVRAKKGPSLVLKCFRLECETLPQFQYRFALSERDPAPEMKREVGGPLSFEEALEADDEP